MPTRKASAVWNGGLKGGNGSFKGETGLGGSYSFGSRFENGTGSNPEELLAAAEAACFSMALSGNLEKNGTPPTKVETSAACTIEKVADKMTVSKIELTVKASVAGVDKATFDRIIEETRTGCPVSRALQAVPISVQASLA
jgi:osmotically inducible protein OsmC